MKTCIQRIKKGKVTLVENGQTSGEIDIGLLILLGIRINDTNEDAKFLAGKIANLRIFEDEQGKMNRSLLDIGGKALVVSQFTLYGNCQKGRRPSFTEAASPEFAKPIYESFIIFLKNEGISVETGVFQAEMDIELVNDGPVTVLIDTDR